MRTTLVRCRTLNDKADDNQRAVDAVFAELARTVPWGAPGATFYHVVVAEAGSTTLGARIGRPPVSTSLGVVGTGRMVPA